MTQVNWMRQLALAVTLFVLGSFAYWLEFKKKPQKETQEEQSKKVFALKDTPVHSVLLASDSKTVEFACSDVTAKLCKPGDNSKWEITSPMKVKGDDTNVNSLLSALNQLQATEIIDLQEETPEKRAALLKEYGLDPQSRASARRIEVRTGDQQLTAYLGQSHPINDSIFTVVEKTKAGEKSTGQVDETKVYLIPSYFKSNFDHDLVYWRDKKLLTVAAHEIESFRLESKKSGGLTATRKDGQWILKTPKDEYAGDIETIDSLLSGAVFLAAKGFVADNKNDPKAAALLKGAQPALKLSLNKSGEKEETAPIVLTLFSKDQGKKLYATVSNVDPIFELEPSAKDRLDKEPRDLRLTKLITSMERFSAKRLEFEGPTVGNKPLVVQNNNGKWQFADKSDANNDQVQKTLDKLSGNRIREFVSGSSIPAGEKTGLKITLGDDKIPAKRQLVFWKAGAQLYARDLLSKRNEAFIVDPAVQEGLPTNPEYFKQAPAPEKTPPAAEKKADSVDEHGHSTHAH